MSLLTSPLFIKVPVPNQECERSCICARGIDVNGHVFVLGVSMWAVVYLC